MNKHLLILTLFWLLGFYANAQDQLFKKDNSKILVTITEIGPDAVKYKMADNPNGPVYVISKSDVVMIIYKNGDHEVFSNTNSHPKDVYVYDQASPSVGGRSKMDPEDSVKYYQYNKNISVNFCNLMNMEVGAMFQLDLFKNHIGIIVPMAAGIGKPSVTQSVYFGNQSYYNGFNSQYVLQQKLFEVGLGLNYYPNLKYSVNYYVGPVVKYMQYKGEQTFVSYTNTWGPGGQQLPPTRLTMNSILHRYTFSITNGFIFRTRSRIMFNIFGSLGFKNDQLSEVIYDPTTGQATSPIRSPVNVYFWGGFNLGFSF